MADNRTFLEIEIDTKKAQQELKDLKRHAEELDAEFQGGSVTEEEYTRSMKVMQIEANALRQVIKDNKVEMQANTREVFAAKGSYNQLSAEYTRLKNEMNNLDPQSDKWKQLSKQASDVYDKMNELQKATGKYSLQVGNYSIALGGFKEQLKGAATQMIGLTKAALSFIATPIGAVVTAIATALGAMYKALTSTAQGQQTLARITGTLKGVLSGLWEVVVQVGEALYSLVTLDFRGFAKNIAEVGKAVANIGKVANETGKISQARARLEQQEAKFVETEAKLNKQIAEQNLIMRDTTKSAQQRAEAQKKINELEDKQLQEKSKFLKQRIALMEQEQSLTSNDAQANAELSQLKADLVNLETEMINKKTSRLKVEANISKELNNQTKEIEKQVSWYDTLEAKVFNFFRRQREQAEANAQKKYENTLQIDEAITKFEYDNFLKQEKTVDARYQRQLDAENNLLNELNRLQKEGLLQYGAYEAEKTRIEEAGKQQRKAIAEQIAKEEEIANKQHLLKMSHDWAGYSADLIKSVGEFTSENAKKSKQQFELNKKLQYAQTSMEGIRAGIKVFTSEGSFYEHLAQAAAIAISTGASLAKISNTSFSSASSSPTVQNTTQSVNNSILQRYNTQELFNRPQTVLVVDEVTAKQQQISNSQKLAVV